MSYQVDFGIWSSVFVVPSCVVDEHIKMCSPLSLKILLLMLRHSDMPVDAAWISQQLNLPAGEISDAINYWVGAGIIKNSDAPASAATLPAAEPLSSSFPHSAVPMPAPAANAQTVTVPSGQKIVTMSARPKINREDINQIAQDDPSIALLLEEAQKIMGAPLSPVESEIVVSLCSYYGMQWDTALMLLQFCVQRGHKSMNYVEKTACAWLEKGIITHEQIEQEILRLTQNNENEKKIIQVFGLYNRGLTQKERDYVEKWFALGLEENMIFLACERAAENTGKVSFAYADKILQSWKDKGITTIKSAIDDLNAGKPSSGPQSKSTTVSDSSLDMDKLHKLLHQSN